MSLDQSTLIAHLQKKYGLDPGSFDSSTPLFSSSLLDSFTMVDLIMFIEKSAGIRLAPTEVSLDNLDSVDRIIAFVHRRTEDA